MARARNLIVAVGLVAFAAAGMTFPFYMASSRKPVIDPTKPLPPQATFLGPYINTGSRDVKFLYLSLVDHDFEGNYGWEIFSVRGVTQSVCMVYVDLSNFNKKLNDRYKSTHTIIVAGLLPITQEGRIDEDGKLQCSYHGWSFDGCGSCVKIPQASSEGPEARAIGSPKACATRFPTLVSQGLLFVWPDENGWEKAKASKPPMLPDDFDKPEFATVNIQRDLFYGYDTLMENVSDPSHIEFAHHKVTGRRDRAKPLPFKMDSRGSWGFSGANEGNPQISAKFVAPCYMMNKIEIDTKLPVVGDQKWVVWICSFNVPMAPGKTRSIVCSARNFFQFSVPGPAWWQVVPRWYEHWTSNKVYDGDMIVLQGQEKIFLSETKEGGDINKQYTNITFTPTQADRFVLAFRNWLRRHGNGQPEWFGNSSDQPLPSTVLSKRQMLDRFEQHTLKCSSCKAAYEGFQTWQKVLIGATVVFCATSGIPSDFQLRVLLAGLAVVSAAIAFALNQLQKNFEFVDYVHAEID
ncbi:Pheophorbide a oxygenase, chloroplastic [Glycine soja]